MNVPFCYFPSGHRSYALVRSVRNSTTASLFYQETLSSGYPKDVEMIRMDVTILAEDIVRVKVDFNKFPVIVYD